MYDSSGSSFSSGSPLMVWDSSEPTLSPLHPLAEEHVPSSERQWWPVEFVGAEKGAVAVGTCKSRVTQSVTAILRRRKAVFTRNSEGTASRSCQKSGEGRWAGGGRTGWESRGFHPEDTHMLCAEGRCSVLTCVTSSAVVLSGSLCGSRMLCPHTYACTSISRRL